LGQRRSVKKAFRFFPNDLLVHQQGAMAFALLLRLTASHLAASDSPTDAAEAIDSDVDRHGDRDWTEVKKWNGTAVKTDGPRYAVLQEPFQRWVQ
jgi:hypothetical protein